MKLRIHKSLARRYTKSWLHRRLRRMARRATAKERDIANALLQKESG